MDTRQDLGNLKLKLLKKFVLPQIDPNNLSLRNTINETKSIGKIWYELILNNLEFSQLIKNGILPTTDELAEIIEPDLINTWHLICKTEEHHDKLRSLLDRGIYPSVEALNQIDPKNNTSAWYWIAYHPELSDIFQLLLTKGIIPRSEILNRIHTENNTSVWHWLGGIHKNCSIFKILLDKKIYPSAEALNKIDAIDKTCGWFWLPACDPDDIIFKMLLDKGIYPSPEALNHINPKMNISAWHLMSEKRTFILIVKMLFDQGIYPSSDALNHLHQSNASAWYWWAGQGGDIIQILVEKGIYPNVDVLNQIHKKHNITAWFWLATNLIRSAGFKLLLTKGIYPSNAALNQCYSINNTSIWYWLVSNDERADLFVMLLDKGYYPSREILNQASMRDQENVWERLITYDVNKVISILLDRDILPTLEIFNQLVKKTSKQNNALNQLSKRMLKIEHLTKNYGIAEKNITTTLVSREDNANFYGFLYLFYLMTTKKYPEINLPSEVWLVIGSFLLPANLDVNLLRYPAQKQAFLKSHIMSQLEKYSATFFYNFKKESVMNLMNQIKKEENPYSTIWKEYWLSRFPEKKFSLPNNNSKNKNLFSPQMDKGLQAILKDSCFLHSR